MGKLPKAPGAKWVGRESEIKRRFVITHLAFILLLTSKYSVGYWVGSTSQDWSQHTIDVFWRLLTLYNSDVKLLSNRILHDNAEELEWIDKAHQREGVLSAPGSFVERLWGLSPHTINVFSCPNIHRLIIYPQNEDVNNWTKLDFPISSVFCRDCLISGAPVCEYFPASLSSPCIPLARPWLLMNVVVLIHHSSQWCLSHHQKGLKETGNVFLR